MVELFQNNVKEFNRQSSKGNQLKWKCDCLWYKADYLGYEGLSEVVISHLLKASSLQEQEIAIYEPEQIKYKNQIFNGVVSNNFRPEGWQLITLERLYLNIKGESLHKKIYHFPNLKNRLEYLVNEICLLTGLKDFGIYMSKLLTIDALFLNEDRHMHNIALFTDNMGGYRLCPIFDNGGALLSDTTMEYPMSEDVFELMKTVKAKTFTDDFDEQLDIAEELFGKNITFSYNNKDIEKIVDAISIYSEKEKDRVKQILRIQMKKYGYLF